MNSFSNNKKTTFFSRLQYFIDVNAVEVNFYKQSMRMKTIASRAGRTAVRQCGIMRPSVDFIQAVI